MTPKRRRITPARAVVALTLLALAALLVTHGAELRRRATFQWNGTIPVDGFVLHVDPDDKVMTEVLLESGAWEPHEVRALFAQVRPGDVFVDVGASFGYYTLLASRAVGPTGRVIAFEPEPAAFALLQKNVAANGCTNVTAVQKALSNAPGKLTLHLAADNRGGHTIVSDVGGGTVDVEAVRFDDWLAGTDGRVDVVKIDTEGAEGFILEGMAEALRRNRGVRLMIEFLPAKLAEAGYGPEKFFGLIGGQGFRVREIDPFDESLAAVTAGELMERPGVRRRGMTNLLLIRDE